MQNFLFKPGKLGRSPNIYIYLTNQEVGELLKKHLSGNYGLVDKEQSNKNKDLLEAPVKRKVGRIKSIHLVRGWKVVIVTLLHRNYTAIVFEPEAARWNY